MKLMLVLLVRSISLRRHPQEHHGRNTALSEKWIYYPSESDKNVGPIPMATGVGVMCSPGRNVLDQKSVLLSM
jgi:hypothetical protein